MASAPSSGSGGSTTSAGSNTATSQTATAATTATSQTAQTAAMAQHAQNSLQHSIQALQAQQIIQQSATHNLMLPPVANGLGVGGLLPDSGMPSQSPNPVIQVINLNSTGNTVTVSNGGTLTLPTATPTNDKVSISGGGTITSSSGTVTATSGALTTTTGGTLSTTLGGSITTASTGGTITSASATTLTSTTVATLTVPGSATTLNIAANTPVSVPAGGTIRLTGAGTVSVASGAADTITLSGAGTLSLPGSGSAASNGTITTNSGTTTFSGNMVSTLPAGSMVTFAGSGSLSLMGVGTDTLPVIVPSTVNNFSTTGTVLNTASYTLPGSWTGVGSLSQSTTSGSTPDVTVTVQQNAQQALLNWQSFNVGSNTTLDFDQSAGGASVGNWVAFNKIGNAMAPSEILGRIEAPGQVYVINQNGIIFGGSSQVNVHALVASSLPINDNLVSRGLLNNPDEQFLFSQLNLPAGAQGPTPAFTPPPAPASGMVADQNATGVFPLSAANGRDGDVIVQPGAQITSPTTADHVGGKIALIGPNVSNAGTINTPDGQTILAAGLQVGFNAHNVNDPLLRGLDTYVGAISDPTYQGGATGVSGIVSNSGLIEAPRANVTMVGAAVNQLGVIDSSTSVALNGSIDLEANYNTVVSNPALTLRPPAFVPTLSGVVTLGPGSLTQILPEVSSTDKVVGSSLALNSIVTIQGEAIDMAAGATLLAPSATVNLEAGQWVFQSSNYEFAYTDGQVYLDSSAMIDVSGTEDNNASVTENIIPVQLRGAELANSPLQQNGPLRGQTVMVDITQTGINSDGTTWVGSPIGKLTGYANLVEHTVGELTSAGGTVNIQAGKSVVMQNGATVNVAGGWVDYQGALVQTTKVISDGHIYDISQATPNRIYDGIYKGFTASSAKWGTSQTFTNPLLTGATYEQGYTQGGNGGVLSITAPSMALDGTVYGGNYTGVRQRTNTPKPSSLSLNFIAQQSVAGSIINYAPTPPDVIFGASTGQTTVLAFAGVDTSGSTAALPPDRQKTVYISPDIVNANGIGLLDIEDPDGNITLPFGISLKAQPGGGATLSGANVELDGNISAPDGSITINAYGVEPYLVSGVAAPSPRGQLTLGTNATLTVAGMVVNDLDPVSTAEPLLTGGGSVTINARTATLDSGSLVDASGGAHLSAMGSFSYGSGGNILINTGQDNNVFGNVGGKLTLNGTLQAYSGTTGGKLTLEAPTVQVGGATNDPTTLRLDPSFLTLGGFGGFTLEGVGEGSSLQPGAGYVPGFLLASGTALGTSTAPLATEMYVGSLDGGNNIVLTPTLLPQSLRAPVSLTFGALGVTDSSGLVIRGDVVMDTGSSVYTDPLANVALNGNTVTVLGRIYAPGGSISVSGATASKTIVLSDPTQPLVSVDLGPQSVLSTAGATKPTPNALGYRTGQVLPGGTINIKGNIVAEKGALLDVSGTSDTLDFRPGYVNGAPGTTLAGNQYVPALVASDGGNIVLSGGEELFMDATLKGGAGGASVQGGNLVVQSGRFYLSTDIPSPEAATLEVTKDAPAIMVPSGQMVVGNSVTDANSVLLPGQGYFGADSFTGSGFDSLALNGVVQFHGSVSINANRSITVGTGGFVFADSTVNLGAPYVAIGQAFQGPLTPAQLQLGYVFSQGNQAFQIPPSYGAGTLSVSGSLIDVGNLSLQGIGALNLTATNGDIRGDGIVDIAGKATLTAGQIYPTTQTTFTLAAYDYTDLTGAEHGSVTIGQSGATRQLPLSAGGVLNIYASDITQGGTLRAPIGTINLGAGVTGANPIDPLSGQTVASARNVTLTANSVTSVSAVDPTTGAARIIPYGVNLNGVSWIDPSGQDITGGGVPAKQINISALNVNDNTGATIDISGGGDLYAYRFVTGTGGTVDILASNGSYAVIPGSTFDYAPIDPGYGNNTLAVGEQVYLNAGNGLPAGVYTLLPARYALLPGAFLVTPQSSSVVPASTAALQLDGSSLVSGYMYNGLDAAQTSHTLYCEFEVASQSVVRKRAEYDDSFANTFLRQGAISNNAVVPRLPMDAGQLVLAATQTMAVDGALSAQASAGGLRSEVDISSPTPIDIVGAGQQGHPGSLILDAGNLTAFDAGSLLIGGYRQNTSAGTTVTVTTGDLEVDNAGTPLSEQGVILVSKARLALDPGADIEATGLASNSSPELLLNGDGTLLRVSNDPSAQVVRSGVNPSDLNPNLSIGAGVHLSGQSLTLDSTATASLDPSATLSIASVNLDGGNISLELQPPVVGQSQPAATSLTLSASVLQALQASARNLSLLSYTTIDTYGSGQIGGVDMKGNYLAQSLVLHAAGLRAFNQDGGTVTFNAQTLTLDNSVNGTVSISAPMAAESVAFNADVVQLGQGANGFSVSGFSVASLTAVSGITLQGAGGFNTAGTLNIASPVITGTDAANQVITANGAVTLQAPSGPAGSTVLVSGLGANLVIQGASVTDSTSIILPSGQVKLHAVTGDVSISSGSIKVEGQVKPLYDLANYTNGGEISLIADQGNVNMNNVSVVSVAAAAQGGNAGSLTISAPTGNFTFAGGTISGQGGANGHGGAFSLDIAGAPNQVVDLTPLNNILNGDGFTDSRSFRVRNDNVQVGDGSTDTAVAQTFNLSADAGSITVNGKIDASGSTGGAIDLAASGDVTLASNSELTVEGANFNDAGKGGSVVLESGSETGGVAGPGFVNIAAGSKINLAVDADNDSADGGNSAALGHFTGTLHIRAPQNVAGTDVQVAPIDGAITGASSIVVEGYKIYNLSNASGSTITTADEQNVLNDGDAFLGAAGTTTQAYADMQNRLFSGVPNLLPVAGIQTGAEIVNPLGNLTLAADWELSTYRFGPNGTPGDLTLRAAGDLVFNGTLSDGFINSRNTAALMTQNSALPINAQSWSYRLVAGADFSAADYHRVLPLSSLGSGGSLKLGVNDNKIGSSLGAKNLSTLTTANALAGSTSAAANPLYYQVIRTGTGDIDIAAGNNVYLLNQFAAIYTAGVQAAALPTSEFDVPILKTTGSQGALGAVQETPYYPAQYELAGGNVTIAAQNDIAHKTLNSQNQLVDDSEKQMPNNWLDRRGFVNSTGQFGPTANADIASTSWWTDFSNFFEGVGALGGGNVALTAGHDVSNVDAVAPTNMRVTKDASTSIELGGGDVTVMAGNNINAGVYYVERGQGNLTAGNQILTSSTRAALNQTTLGADTLNGITPDPTTWLPTTLFLGSKSSFDLAAQGNIELGPVANVFLLPEGISNTYWDKTYFSTYGTDDKVNVSSLTGSVTLRESTTLPSSTSAVPFLEAWLQNVELLTTLPNNSVSAFEPWLRIDETSVTPFNTVVSIMAPTLKVTAISGDIAVDGNLTLSPSPQGTIDLVAGGAISGLQVNGVSSNLTYWSSSAINLSDASPSVIPGVLTPYAYETVSGTKPSSSTSALLNLSIINNLFQVSGSTQGAYAVLQTKQELHGVDPNSPANESLPLHADDPNPVHLYAGAGDISGFTLYAGKSADVVAGQNLTDIAIYAENNSANDVSVVAAGKDITAYDATSPLRASAQATGNTFDAGQSLPQAGDIRIGGLGTVEVLAGRNFNLGVGPNNADGTGTGLTTIGNAGNPYLPSFGGASVIAAAGIGGVASGLDLNQQLHFKDFIGQYLDPSSAPVEASRYLPDLAAIPAFAALLNQPDATNDQIWSAFNALPASQQDQLALDIFYLVLRDAGRDHNNGSNTTYGNGYTAIAALFPGNKFNGDISLTSREIKTQNGGDISIFAPGGQLTVGFDIAGNQTVDQGILTEDGGNIDIFTDGNVNVGTSRIFTLRGGNEIIWSTHGNIAAGASSKTVQSAPPTRVLVDPQSANVQTDLAGLATGGGIGVLDTVVGVAPSDIDLIAPAGIVDAGDAGIRVSGNINIAALQVVNAGNIQVGGASSGVPTVSTPNLGGLAAAGSASGAAINSSSDFAREQSRNQLAQNNQQDMPSIITVEVLGYGGGE